MQHTDNDYQFLQETYAAARNKYKPARLRTLLVAEAPPCNLDRHFYFEDVKTQDSLFLEIMGVLYPERKRRYLAKGRPTEGKVELLELFRDDGYWLLDLYEVPGDLPAEVLQNAVPNLMKRLEKLAEEQTTILLIKTNIFDLCYAPLDAGYRVSAERMPFPGSGQQRVFREKFARAIEG